MDRKLAEQDFEAGKKSMTDLPVLAKKNDEGKLQVMDGNGRILQAEADGLETHFILLLMRNCTYKNLKNKK